MDTPMIQIINYQLGNLGSVQNMLNRLGIASAIVDRPDDLREGRMILPGVGSFDTGMKNLHEQGWVNALNTYVAGGTPVLGICLGMQLMMAKSEEGTSEGLGWVKGEVLRFPSATGLKIPHMGWNVVRETSGRPSILTNPEREELRFYFVHSYFVRLEDQAHEIGATTYGIDFTSAFQHRNLFGVQFHPEKSHQFGMKLLQNFAAYQHA